MAIDTCSTFPKQQRAIVEAVGNVQEVGIFIFNPIGLKFSLGLRALCKVELWPYTGFKFHERSVWRMPSIASLYSLMPGDYTRTPAQTRSI
jgi:hypothetical protein